MKTVRSPKNTLHRVSDYEAQFLVESYNYTYASKQEWKDEVRNVSTEEG